MSNLTEQKIDTLLEVVQELEYYGDTVTGNLVLKALRCDCNNNHEDITEDDITLFLKCFGIEKGTKDV